MVFNSEPALLASDGGRDRGPRSLLFTHEDESCPARPGLRRRERAARPEVANAIAAGAHQNRSDGVRSEVLLEVLVHGDEDLKLPGRSPKQHAVLEACPPSPTTVCASSPVGSSAKSMGIDSSSRTRTGHHLIAGVFQRRDGLLATNGWELVQKLLEPSRSGSLCTTSSGNRNEVAICPNLADSLMVCIRIAGGVVGTGAGGSDGPPPR